MNSASDKKAWCTTCSTEMVWHQFPEKWYCPGCQANISNEAMLTTHAFVHPWVPMCEPIDIKHVGKMIEEVCELGAALARCLIQGIDEVEPITKKPNRQWLQEEIADVLANCQLVAAHFNLDKDAVRERRDKKKVRLSAWHKMLAHHAPIATERFLDPAGTPPSTEDDFGDPAMPVSEPTPRRKRNATQKRNKRKGVRSG